MVRLSPPRRLRSAAGAIVVAVHETVVATKDPAFGTTPRIEVRIGRWSPHVGSLSRVHSRVVAVRVSMVHSDLANSTFLMLAADGKPVPVKTSLEVASFQV